MPVRFSADSGGFVIESDYCGDCGSPLYDTGCDAPGCAAEEGVAAELRQSDAS